MEWRFFVLMSCVKCSSRWELRFKYKNWYLWYQLAVCCFNPVQSLKINQCYYDMGRCSNTETIYNNLLIIQRCLLWFLYIHDTLPAFVYCFCDGREGYPWCCASSLFTMTLKWQANYLCHRNVNINRAIKGLKVL